ncbi:MAG: alpha-amylase family protein, partial [Bryobacteraceae bacterium]
MFLLIALASASFAQSESPLPLIGAQVWFEPGEEDTEQAIDHIFKTLADNQMPLARVSLVWNYIERTPGNWDFTLFDRVFRSAEKHHVRIAATLWPAAKVYWLSGMPDTAEQMKAGERYLADVVSRYKNSPALDTWILMNEPRHTPANNPLAIQRFRIWLQKKYGSVDALNRAWLQDSMVPFRPPYSSFEEVEFDSRWASGTSSWHIPSLDWLAFWRNHLTWYLGWVAGEVRKIDPNHPLHVNPTPLASNLAAHSLDLPAWRPILSSLGFSAYPQRSFLPFFPPGRHALGFSYMIDLASGAIEPKPAWVTELPGGPLVRGFPQVFTPTPEDIAQWTWTSIGGGAERIIFWMLNPRRKAREMGDTGLLDYQGRPTERLNATSAIAKVINSNSDLFQKARTLESPVTIFLSLDSMSQEWYFKDPDAPVQSALGFYQVLNELGIPVRVKHINDYDWRAKSPKPRLAILPDVSALSPEQASDIEAFVRNGNSLFISGFTGFFDLGARFLPMKKFPFEDLIGAGVRDMRMVEGDCQIELLQPRLTLPSHWHIVEIDNRSADVIGRQGEWVTAVRKKVGSGEVIWIPSPIGRAAYTGDRLPLAQLMQTVTASFTGQLPF